MCTYFITGLYCTRTDTGTCQVFLSRLRSSLAPDVRIRSQAAANTIIDHCARLRRPPLTPTQKKTTTVPSSPAADVHVSQDTLTPLKPVAGSFNRCSNPDFPCAVHRPSIGRTPPVTPPGRSASPCSPHVGGSPHGSASGGSPHAAGKGVAAPASVVDDVMEKFGRPRARSLSRSDRISLPAWKEENDEVPPPAPKIEDRRRTVSMSAAELTRDRKPSPEVRRVLTIEMRVFPTTVVVV